jgi:hypothetical protein
MRIRDSNIHTRKTMASTFSSMKYVSQLRQRGNPLFPASMLLTIPTVSTPPKGISASLNSAKGNSDSEFGRALLRRKNRLDLRGILRSSDAFWAAPFICHISLNLFPRGFPAEIFQFAFVSVNRRYSRMIRKPVSFLR